MTVESNKAMERRMVEEALNCGNMKTVEECLNPDFVYHGPGGAEIKSIQGYQNFLAGLRTYYPDMRVTIENIIGEGDFVSTRTSSIFTYKGKAVSMTGSIMDRFKDGKISETWEEFDRLELYRSLGIIPACPAKK